MENLDELWTRIGSVSKEEVIVAVLKDEIEVYKTRLKPKYTAHLRTVISVIEDRIKEVKSPKVNVYFQHEQELKERVT